MSKDKKKALLDVNKPSASRARNKTVMLTPDIASQMRSRINAGSNRSGQTEKIDNSLLEEIRADQGSALASGENPLDAIAKKLEAAASINQKDDQGSDNPTINTELLGAADQESLTEDPLELLSEIDELDLPAEDEAAETALEEQDSPAEEESSSDQEDLSSMFTVKTEAKDDSGTAEIKDFSEKADEFDLDQILSDADDKLANEQEVSSADEDLLLDSLTSGYETETDKGNQSFNDLIDQQETADEANPKTNKETMSTNENFGDSQDIYSLSADNVNAAPVAAAAAAKISESEKQVSASGNATNGDRIIWEKEGKITGFLVSFDDNEQGDYFILRPGRLIVSNEKSERGSMLILGHESVSPLHAIVRVSGNNVIVLDQLSENGTKVVRKDGETLDLSGDKAELQHNDQLSFGDKSFTVCLLA